ncbi:uncharacterized protein LOC115754534 [Rhodamnia argentea]|uniref:Uncharacterized protein LOC115754534 n=1 Tax=Rhodamnia argentea TaxID=178133 RepID=A0A8B8QQH6_9MYRT|nr:uncharacterized protein LOC115754534 [Rhodamnia argentea]
MDRARNNKAQGTERLVPGCLGRMVNLFDLSTGAASKKLLTYKPHFDDPSLTRSQPDVPRMLSPSRRNDMEDKMIISNSRRSSPNKQPNSTPMKMLIAQEMSREMESKHCSPNVVAKLMGLDGLPRQNPDLLADVSPLRNYSSPCLIPQEIPYQSWLQEDTFVHEQDASFKCREIDDYKDIFEVEKISQKTNSAREMSPHMGKYGGKGREKRRMVIQQKFMEAKCQATDEKLNQSKELQDALEVLNSKRVFLLEFIKEPNNLFSKHLQELESTCAPSETKRITVLRPSKMVDNEKYPMTRKKNEHLAKRAEVSQEIRWGKSRSVGSPDYVSHNGADHGSQPTRIVVLKPSLGQTHEIESTSPSSMIPKKLPGENFFEEAEDGDVQLSREVAKEVTHNVRESMKGHRRDETLLSSVFSNGYSGDGSSFNKSEYEFPQQNCSDSEVLSPASRHSWDGINRYDSPLSASSLSCASYSPESTVSREAKKRLSERFMASNKNTREERHIHKTSGTLGEMLALSDTKMSTRREEDGNNIEREPRMSASCLRNKSSEIEEVAESPKSLLRSKSLPVSSMLYSDAIRTRTSDPEASKMHVHKESKEKGLSLSFKGRVSNFFLSRRTRLGKEKSGKCESADDSCGVNGPESSICPRSKSSTHASQYFEENQIEASENSARRGLLNKTTRPMQTVQNENSISEEVGLPVSKPVLGSVGENQDQPSPISVLEPSFEEDASIIYEYPGKQLPVQSLKSNLIDKSPPIGSIARSLSWGDYPERAFLCLSKPSTTYSGSKEEEEDCFGFIEKLLTIPSLDGTGESYSHVSSWHSPHSPLDPSLREKYADVDNDEPLNEAKRRQRRSNRKLIYDCVNAAIVDIAGFGPGECLVDRFCCGPGDLLMEEKSSITADIIWSQIKEWFTKVRSVSGDDEDHNCAVVESAVKEEFVGKGRLGLFRLEVDNLGRDIEGALLEVLVAEALSDLVVSVC